jgi:TPR repeat protein
MDSNVVILPQNDVEAYLWARKAADRGYAKAEYAVGYYTETGVGVKQSLDEARRWYMRAAAQNNRRAMQRLAELKKHGNIQQRKKHTRDQTGRSNEKDSDCSIM